MSTTKITSEILKIESPIRDVYALLSDFSRIGRLVEMAKQMGMTNGLEMDKISEKIESTRFTEDACYITLKGMGELAVKIVEKEEPKLIKLGGDGATPFEFNLWIQLLENGPYDTRMKITFQGELNMVMKMMLKGKLEKGINQLGEGLAKIPYSLLSNSGFCNIIILKISSGVRCTIGYFQNNFYFMPSISGHSRDSSFLRHKLW